MNGDHLYAPLVASEGEVSRHVPSQLQSGPDHTAKGIPKATVRVETVTEQNQIDRVGVGRPWPGRGSETAGK